MIAVSWQAIGGRLLALGKQRLLREGLWVSLGYGATIASGLIGVRLFTELAAPSVFGGANLLLGMVTLGIHIFVSPIAQTQIRFHSAYLKKNEGDEFTGVISRLTLLVCLLLSAAAAVCLLLWPNLRAGASPLAVLLLAGFIFASVYRGTMLGRLQAERRQRSYSIWVATEAFAILGMTGFALYFSPTIEGFISGQLLGTASVALIFSISDLSRIYRNGNDANIFEQVRYRIFQYGSPFALLSLLSWLSNLSERYVLAAYLDVASVGLYVGAFSIASRIPTLTSSIFSDIFRPMLFESKNADGDQGKENSILALWSALLCINAVGVFVIIYWFAPMLSSILLAPAYRAVAIDLMPIICIGFTLNTFTSMFDQIMFANSNTRRVIIPKFVGPITGLAIAIWLVPSIGVRGAAISSCVGNAVQFLLAFLICFRSIAFQQIRLPDPSRI
jgi:O-antigen/teichoic acid export membrane protein